MNYHKQYKQHKYGELKVCRVCGLNAGARKVSVKHPDHFYVVCEICGYKTRPHSTVAGATREWNNERKDDYER